jgi:hypothetical protein
MLCNFPEECRYRVLDGRSLKTAVFFFTDTVLNTDNVESSRMLNESSAATTASNIHNLEHTALLIVFPV